jgi:hypothetical protein
MSTVRKIKCLAALLVLSALIICRATIPISADGDWMGSLTKCACGDYWFMRLQDGHIRWYAHSDDQGSKPQDFGTYVKTGWSTSRWDFSRGGGAVTMRAGWLLSSFDGLPGNGRLYCWRYPLRWNADRVVRLMEANEKEAKDKNETKK